MPEAHDNSVELLAPAGGPEALVAAVNNGADAVYLGLSEFNARRSATNFDIDSLAEGARFAHLRDARVYLTANIVVLPDELLPALKMIDSAWSAGIDAVIVQDLGLMRALRLALPEVRIHASTQIDVQNPDGIGALASLGASRVTLARELSLEAIAACAAAGLEVETFVHGALCYSYSGQCLLSSLIGRRSANRGMCAQPCRLPYELLDAFGGVATVPGRYLLSPRDLAGIAHLPELVRAGVKALKIEGRMKSPEYVAIASGVYRAALDRALADPDGFSVLPSEWEMLEEAFSRGFTDGYLTGRRGEDLMSYTRPNNRGVLIGRVTASSGHGPTVDLERALDPADTLEVWTRSGRFAQTAGPLRVSGAPVAVAPAGSTAEIALEQPVSAGDRVFRVANDALLSAARRTFTGGAVADHRGTTVDFDVRVRVGEPLRILARAGGLAATAEGAEVLPARTKAITPDEIVEHVGRLGGSGYGAGAWKLDLDAAAGLAYSALHAVRREALERLTALRLEPWSARRRFMPDEPELPAPARRRQGTPELVATVWDLEVAVACLEAGADRVLLRVFGAPSDPAPDELPAGVTPLLPRIVWPAEAAAFDKWGDCGRVTAGNLGTLRRMVPACQVEADWPLNIVNTHAAAALEDLGADFVWASPELSGRQLFDLAARSPLPVGTLVWGRIEMMVAEQCVLQASGACGRRCASCMRRKSWWRLRDQKGYEFPVTTDPAGRSHIMNSVTLDLTRALDEVVASGVAALRLDFSDETPTRAAEVVRGVRSSLTSVSAGGRPPETPLVEPSTSGHFYRGLL